MTSEEFWGCWQEKRKAKARRDRRFFIGFGFERIKIRKETGKIEFEKKLTNSA